MEEDNMEFFTTSQNTTALNQFKSRMEEIQTTDEFEMERNGSILTIIQSIATIPEEWDKLCQVNIGWIGDRFITELYNTTEELTKKRIDSIFAMCFRFLLELELSIKEDLSMELERAMRFAFENIDGFEQDAKSRMEFAIRRMPISIFKSIANSESIESIKALDRVSGTAEIRRKEWENDLSERELRVETLKSELSQYETAFNFVGLFQGFDDLSKEKKREISGILFWLQIVGFLIVVPLITEIIVLYSNLSDIAKIKDVLVLSFIPTVSLVAIFIYYFRVLLYNYKSTKSQLLQIELRKTLCRFIQSYSDYASALKEQDKDSLSKFENIIFSGIVSGDDNLPSTYDGLEQLANLIKSIK